MHCLCALIIYALLLCTGYIISAHKQCIYSSLHTFQLHFASNVMTAFMILGLSAVFSQIREVVGSDYHSSHNMHISLSSAYCMDFLLQCIHPALGVGSLGMGVGTGREKESRDWHPSLKITFMRDLLSCTEVSSPF